MITIVLFVIVIFLAGYVAPKLAMKGVEYFERRQIESKAIKLALESPVDEEGFHKEYDPHLTRKLEAEQGIKGVLTQCDDEKCATCQWKIRNIRPVSAFSSGEYAYIMSIFTERINAFIKELPDGMSDDFYDMALKHHEAELKIKMESAFKEAEDKARARQKAKERAADEAFYNTPYDKIEEYLAEGRVFNKNNNSWSNPKDARVLEESISKAPIDVKRAPKNAWSGAFANAMFDETVLDEQVKKIKAAHSVPPTPALRKDMPDPGNRPVKKSWRQFNAELEQETKMFENRLNELSMQKKSFQQKFEKLRSELNDPRNNY